jgi:hypothetical protein
MVGKARMMAPKRLGKKCRASCRLIDAIRNAPDPWPLKAHRYGRR